VRSEVDLAKEYMETLLRTQHFAPADLDAYQAGILAHLLRHAKANVPFYRDRIFPAQDIKVASPAWLDVPTIDRGVVATQGVALRALRTPEGHGKIRLASSGGSTGSPIQVAVSELEALGRVVCTYRMFVDYSMQPSLPLFMIRRQPTGLRSPEGVVAGKWAFPWLPREQIGDRIHLDIGLPPPAQIDRLTERSPAYVNTLPSNLLRIGLEARRQPRPLAVPIVVSVAEYLPPEVRTLARETLGSRVINILPSSEAGVIAIECPEAGKLHIQSELTLAEIIDERGQPCEPGQTGELVVTPLYNYGMPLIRYRSGDFVVKGAPCACGRSLPTIERFVGRKEHLFVLPDGVRELPPIDRVFVSELVGHDAWQFVQTSAHTAELRSEPSAKLHDAAEAIQRHASDAVRGLLSVEVREVPAIPLTAGGKRHFTVNLAQANEA
jgi:phenylacetate-CoA ligase